MVERTDLTTDEFRSFQEFIYERSGIRIPESKRTLLSNRIRRRLRADDFASFRSYLTHLKSAKPNELTGFLDAITTNETFFFRTEDHFTWFRDRFIPEVASLARRDLRPKRLRIWSAACSTGEEPYSLAICLAENQLRLRDWDLQIVGTDLSEEALEKARLATYEERTLNGVKESRRRRYFTKLDPPPRWQVKSALRDQVTFKRHNLMEPYVGRPFDCVFIRNVLIYFDRESKQEAVQHLIASMAPGAYLVVGPSEGIFDMLGDLKKHETYLYQK